MTPLSSSCLSILFATLMVMLNLVAMPDGVIAFIFLMVLRVSSVSIGGILKLLVFLVPGLLLDMFVHSLGTGC